ncbi:MAG TPA: serine/threonine protein kinase, partial [Pirellulaceae bacterium]|nr:serine/threonine protein kinase [Pirellulaceae bacterium]
LVSTAADTARERWVGAPEQYELAVELAPELKSHGYQAYFLLDPKFRVISATSPELLGQSFPLTDPLQLAKLAAGKPFVTRPTPSFLPLEDIDGERRQGVPTMFAIAPLVNVAGKQFGMLALRIRPDTDFTRILSVGQFGQTGQTYAFDREGMLLSRTRFDDELKQLGLIVDNPYSTAILSLALRDPQVNLSAGQHPLLSRDRMPLTTMAADAIAGHSGENVRGYRNYLGVPTIGAWKWLPEYGFGVATEVEASEAYRAANILRAVNWGMFSLMCGLSMAIFGFTLVMARLERQVSEASIAMKQVGQYHLGDKLGQGGMGVVYRGQHALLQRPTAIKLLDPAKTSDESIGRFEREVRLTSLLNHPNTITVYDFGRSDEGVFFYAMELLNGMDLEELVMRYGPQPPARVVHLLRQVCGSLAEAHATGLIHRDIKPGNIMLTQRGGINDFIKVLDFGLVKAVRQEKAPSLTTENTLTGTPHYMSPEAIERADSVDARSDLYAVGAVGYFLLTGVPVFDGDRAVEIFM